MHRELKPSAKEEKKTALQNKNMNGLINRKQENKVESIGKNKQYRSCNVTQAKI